mmetsp:Transcript_13862/g.27638  ORF Transcript_13862/g.27638 Transcript_13862/m.27638 type:complete len:125 (+) Transcript_13862:561-935(+)
MHAEERRGDTDGARFNSGNRLFDFLDGPKVDARMHLDIQTDRQSFAFSFCACSFVASFLHQKSGVSLSPIFSLDLSLSFFRRKKRRKRVRRKEQNIKRKMEVVIKKNLFGAMQTRETGSSVIEK